MTSAAHSSQMAQVYGHIYQDRYNHAGKELDDAKALIRKNVSEFGFDPSVLASWTVFNIGTGREAVAFIELGARECHLADLSPLSKQRLDLLKTTNPRYAGLHAYQADVSDPAFRLAATIDFIYLNGVYHHLHDPYQALVNFGEALSVGGYIYLRLYRTGSLKFFVTDFARRFVRFEDAQYFEPVFREYIGDFPKDQGLSHHNVAAHLYEMCYDNLFVPTLNLFDPSRFVEFYESNGFEAINTPNLPPYDHSLDDKGNTGFSLYFRRGEKRAIAEDRRGGLRSVDQLTDIDYREDYILRTVEMMKSALPRLQELQPRPKLKMAIDLFYAAQVFRIYTFYNHTPLTLDAADIMRLSTAKHVHERLRESLAPYA